MLKKDKIKIAVVSILIVLLITSYIIVGKDSVVMKYVSGFCLLAWIATMVITNKKYK